MAKAELVHRVLALHQPAWEGPGRDVPQRDVTRRGTEEGDPLPDEDGDPGDDHLVNEPRDEELLDRRPTVDVHSADPLLVEGGGHFGRSPGDPLHDRAGRGGLQIPMAEDVHRRLAVRPRPFELADHVIGLPAHHQCVDGRHEGVEAVVLGGVVRQPVEPPVGPGDLAVEAHPDEDRGFHGFPSFTRRSETFRTNVLAGRSSSRPVIASPWIIRIHRPWYRGLWNSLTHEPYPCFTKVSSPMNSRTPSTTLSARRETVSFP